MYVPIWVACLLSAVAGSLITFAGFVIAVIVSQKKQKQKGE